MMKNLIVLLGCLFLSTEVSARKPAVEDFMGVPPESEPLPPAGTEVLVNFAQDIEGHSISPKVVIRPAAAPVAATDVGVGVSPWWALIAVFLLPLATWGLVMRRMPQAEALPDNVTPLPARRKATAATAVDERKAS